MKLNTKSTEKRLLDALHSLFATIVAHPDSPSSHYSSIAKTCAQLVQAESCSVWILDRDTGKICLRGGYGYSNLPKESPIPEDFAERFSYLPGHGVTGRVFKTGKASRVRTNAEVPKQLGHKGSNYSRLWSGQRNWRGCHSWYQFALNSGRGEGERIGVMKVENKLGSDKKPIPRGGFSRQDEKTLEVLANSAVSTVHLFAELHAISERSREAGPSAYTQFIPDIDDVFSPQILTSIYSLRSVKDSKLHERIKSFIEHVRREKSAIGSDPLLLAKKHIKATAEVLSFKKDLVDYVNPLSDFQAVLFQIPEYREHFIHQFNVFLIGYLILNRIPQKHFNRFTAWIKTLETAKNGEPVSAREVFQAWFLASMWHDTGYPLGKAGTWAKTLVWKMFGLDDDTAQSPLNVVEPLAARLMRHGAFDWLQFLTDKLRQVFKPHESQGRTLNNTVLDLFVGHLSDDVIAALVLIKAGQQTGLRDSIVAASATAVAAHETGLWEILHRIHFAVHPLAFLLYYCDSAQEHGRQRSGKAVDAFRDWRVSETEIQVKADVVRSILTYSKMPGNWKTAVRPSIGRGATVFVGPSKPEYTIEYQFAEKGERDLVEFSVLHGESED